MKELTKAEEQVMQLLWKKEKAFVKELIEMMPEPKPAYNTVSTIVRILEKKGFVAYEAFGKTHRYFPLISKKEYTRRYMKSFMKGYFSNSFKEMVSFFAREDNMSIADLEELLKEVGEDLENNQSKDNETSR
ncbi:BlaI/MecI/CopY family transcriptional regulator [Sunxiuqinia elliptica]|uniref:Putative transcriptional regulator n=1 Tax=Sunxiuqinia elliptica TaxID=655355 RepID=A0A4R6GU66_9BACT|nr:BlaI/MecI/CopY family transcriptional regulator [Sunxiuqinia elliptica]TDN98981.1 putative transcriptional regulator [Sunxiuqinia elliptica]TDO56421.1 putative transcriptional regulator [Sunxiuqinia elliptica]